MKKGILFDLDGTLWDSGEGVVISWNLALEKMGLTRRVDADFVHANMGKTMDAFAMALFPGEPVEEAVRKMETCLRMENEYLREHGGILFSGLEETLGKLRDQGYFLAIVSNCQEGYIEAFLAYHGLESCFDDFESYGHTGHGKAYNIRLVVERNGLDRALYLGDTQGDYDSTIEAGLPFLHAAYGFGKVPEGTPKIQNIRELPEAAARML